MPRPARAPARILLWRLAYAATRLLLLVWAVVRHDAFVFGSRTSFLQLQDLRLLRWLGKRVVFVFTGSDARPPYIDGADMDQPGSHRRRMHRACACEEAADRNHRTLVHGHRQPPAVPTSSNDRRPDSRFWAGAAAARRVPSRCPRATGATDPDPSFTIESSRRGSELVRATVDRLVAEGLQLELVEIRNVPNWQVHEELQACHFVIDQLYSDVPMSAFAAEAARYEASSRRQLRLGEIARPVPDAHRAGGDVPSRPARGRSTPSRDRPSPPGPARPAARRFVEGWAGEEVARRYLRLLLGERPALWMDDPNEVRYLHGAGLPGGACGRSSRGDQEGGVAALQVSDKPELESAFRELGETPAVSHSPDGDRSLRGGHAATNSTSPSVRPACIGNARMTEMRGMSWRVPDAS